MTTRVSVAADGSQGEDGESDTPSVSADGRYVAFVSWASTLVPGDTNGSPDVFVHDRARHRTTRVSVRSDGAPANHGASAYPVISADGRFVAFSNSSTNLVPGYTRPGMRIYLHDRRRGRTTVVRSRRGRSDNYPSISANGRMVAFERSGRRSARILVWDRKARRTLRVDVSTHDRGANAASVTPAISANGRYVAFVSAASNLVPHEGTAARTSLCEISAVGEQSKRASAQTARRSRVSTRLRGWRRPPPPVRGRTRSFGDRALHRVQQPEPSLRHINASPRQRRLSTRPAAQEDRPGPQQRRVAARSRHFQAMVDCGVHVYRRWTPPPRADAISGSSPRPFACPRNSATSASERSFARPEQAACAACIAASR